MTDRILIVTAPDDTLLDGIRILHVNLSQDQSQVVSTALLQSQLTYSVVNYVWRSGEPIDWLMDKRLKSDIILFNADTSNSDLITGYIAAQSNSYYFGTLKDLYLVNNRAIYSISEIVTLLENIEK
jgi:hypothetical protein